MRIRDKRKILVEYPYCIYCGGKTAATTVDHIPPTGLFPKRDRPPGLVVPACPDCNRNSRVVDDIASFFAAIRLSPNEREVQHFSEKLLYFKNNYPEIMLESQPTIGQLRQAARYTPNNEGTFGALDVRGATTSRMIVLFGVKLGLALHYEETRVALPSQGEIGVIWYTNQNALANEIPQRLFELLPDVRSLGSGRKTANRIFEYSSRSIDDSKKTAHWATFGDSFMFYLFVGEGITGLKVLPSSRVYQPGIFRFPLR